jgi:hypothetical protein
MSTTVDELFVGALVVGVPSIADQMTPKMPGDADGEDKGDHCA